MSSKEFDHEEYWMELLGTVLATPDNEYAELLPEEAAMIQQSENGNTQNSGVANNNQNASSAANDQREFNFEHNKNVSPNYNKTAVAN